MALKGLEAGRADRLMLKGKKLKGNVREALVDEGISIERTITGASQIRLALRDPAYELLRSGIFSERTALTLDGLAFELAAVQKTGRRLALTFEDAAVAQLRRKRKHRVFRSGTLTRARAVRELVETVPGVKYRGEDDKKILKALVVGGRDNRNEDWWDATGRFAEERQWRRFISEAVFHFGSDAWLYQLEAPYVIREGDPAVDAIDFDWNKGKRAQTATIEAWMNRWAAAPGRGVQTPGLGRLMDGPWIVESISTKGHSEKGTVQLTRKVPELAEPKPDPAPDGYDESGPSDGSAGGGFTNGAESSEGWRWPVPGAHPITSPYGPRGSDYHYGIDIDGETGDPIVAAKDGVVAFAGAASGYGNVTYIEHGGGFSSRYGHLSAFAAHAGQQVRAGQVIGSMGATGNATGSHLHFEIRAGGAPVNPMGYLP